jgi:hypothetical protein
VTRTVRSGCAHVRVWRAALGASQKRWPGTLARRTLAMFWRTEYVVFVIGESGVPS